MAGVSYNKGQLHSKWAHMRTKWQVYHHLVGKSGFGWDTVKNCPDVERSVFDAFAAKHEGAAQFWQAPLPMYEELTHCHGIHAATGDYSSS